jgi:KDO2-lipid IV(A) lauroyltransferase
MFLNFIRGAFLNIQQQVSSIPAARDLRSAPTSIVAVKAMVLRLPLLNWYTDFCYVQAYFNKRIVLKSGLCVKQFNDVQNSGHTPGNTMRKPNTKRQMKHAIALGRILGTLAYLVDAPHRRIVRSNLRLAFPDWSEEKIRQTSKRVFEHLGATFVEICQLASYSQADVIARVRVVGAGRWRRELDKNQGLIIVSAHLGNWEVGMHHAACFMQKPTLGVAKKIHFQPLNHWVHRLRTRFGIHIIYKKGALPDMRQALRRDGIVCLLVDQSKRKEGVDVNFFGYRVPATPAAAFLGIRCNSPILPIFCIREASGQLTIHVDQPLNLKWSGDLRADVQANTQLITDAVERMIRQYPEQYFWVHKRWKKYHPHLYPEYQLRRQRRKEREERREQRKAERYQEKG